ncbi:MAG: aldo/keto reductase [Saprospiraceae bacterium]|nr:aldo/keto reductase [Saprospiraceae bacterium]
MRNLIFNNNDKMPVLGLGTWKAKAGEVYNAVLEALNLGYRHIDCAHIYGNESEIGEALRYAFLKGIVNRSDVWITSKLWCNSHKREAVIPALKHTLKNLQLDYLDLYLVHWPVAFSPDTYPTIPNEFISLDEIPLSETWEGMVDAKEENLCRHIGVSNFSILKLKEMMAYSAVKPEVNQIELHPYLQQKEMLDFCNEHNIFLTAYSPLGTSEADKIMANKKETTLLKHPDIIHVASQYNCTPAQVLIQWAIARGTSVIPKSVNPERIKQNFEAALVCLSEEDMNTINQLDLNLRFVDGTFWVMEGAPYTLENLWDEQLIQVHR